MSESGDSIAVTVSKYNFENELILNQSFKTQKNTQTVFSIQPKEILSVKVSLKVRPKTSFPSLTILTTDSTYNFSLEYSNHKGQVVPIPENIVIDNIIYGQTVSVPIVLRNEFQIPLEIEIAEVLDETFASLEITQKRIPPNTETECIIIYVTVASMYSSIKFTDLASSVKYSEIKTEKGLLDTFFTAVRIRTNLISDYLIPIAINPTYGNIIQQDEIKFINAPIATSTLQNIELQNPTDTPIAVTLLLGQDIRAPERKKCNTSCPTKSVISEMTLIDDEEFEHKDPKDSKFNLASKNCCKESNLTDDMQDFRKMTFEPIPDATSQ